MSETRPCSTMDPYKLARNGVIDLGAYVPGKPIEEVKKEFGLDRVVKLASNECPLALPAGLNQAIATELSTICRYPDGHCRNLRDQVAAYVGVQSDNLIFGNGAEESIRLIAQAFLNPGDTSLIPAAIFDAYNTAIRLTGATPVEIPLNNFHIDLEKTLALVDDTTKIIWLCSPNNPTGIVLTQEALDGFLAKLPTDILVVLDEAYFEFVDTPDAAHAVPLMEKDPRVIGIRTFSKAFGLAGLRIGYVVADPRIIEIISMVKLPFNTSRVAQAAAGAMLNEPLFLAEHIALIRNERAFLTRELRARGMEVLDSQANFLLVKLPVKSDEIFARLLPKGFIIRPGSIWGLCDHIRLTLGTREENQCFLELLDEIVAESAKGLN